MLVLLASLIFSSAVDTHIVTRYKAYVDFSSKRMSVNAERVTWTIEPRSFTRGGEDGSITFDDFTVTEYFVDDVRYRRFEIWSNIAPLRGYVVRQKGDQAVVSECVRGYSDPERRGYYGPCAAAYYYLTSNIERFDELAEFGIDVSEWTENSAEPEGRSEVTVESEDEHSDRSSGESYNSGHNPWLRTTTIYINGQPRPAGFEQNLFTYEPGYHAGRLDAQPATVSIQLYLDEGQTWIALWDSNTLMSPLEHRGDVWLFLTDDTTITLLDRGPGGVSKIEGEGSSRFDHYRLTASEVRRLKRAGITAVNFPHYGDRKLFRTINPAGVWLDGQLATLGL